MDFQRRTLRDMNRRTEKAGPLDVKVLDGALVAHQNHAIALLSWLNSQIDAFREFFSCSLGNGVIFIGNTHS